MLTEQQKKHIEYIIYNFLNESVVNNNEEELLKIVTSGEKVYHRPQDARGGDPLTIIKSLFRRGFSREYTGSNGGNMYGTGVYNVYTLRSSNEKATGYGRYIIQSYVIDGYKDFLIFNEDIAKKYYGKNWWIGNQIKMLMPPQIAEKVLRVLGNKLYMNDYHSLDKKTSIVAYNIFNILGESGMKQTKIRGIIYDGGHDGSCAFVRDFSDVCPYAYSDDNGKTWKRAISKELMQHVLGNIDTEFELKHRVDDTGRQQYDDVAKKSINGFSIVYRNNKVNYYSVETRSLISNIWFDEGMNFDEDGFAEVSYHGHELCVHNDGNGNYSITDLDGCPICNINDIKNVIK